MLADTEKASKKFKLEVEHVTRALTVIRGGSQPWRCSQELLVRDGVGFGLEHRDMCTSIGGVLYTRKVLHRSIGLRCIYGCSTPMMHLEHPQSSPYIRALQRGDMGSRGVRWMLQGHLVS